MAGGAQQDLPALRHHIGCQQHAGLHAVWPLIQASMQHPLACEVQAKDCPPRLHSATCVMPGYLQQSSYGGLPLQGQCCGDISAAQRLKMTVCTD